MAGIRIIGRDGAIVSHSAIWADPEEVPVTFVVVKDEAVALAHPDWVASTLYDVSQGDLRLTDAWDELLVKTKKLPYPQKCRVRMLTGTEGAAEILVGNRIVHRFT